MTKEETKQTVEEAAIEARMAIKAAPLDKCEGTVAGGRKACINKT